MRNIRKILRSFEEISRNFCRNLSESFFHLNSRRTLFGKITESRKHKLIPQIFSLLLFYNNYGEICKKKNWRRKCVRGAIFRTVEVRVEGGVDTFNPYFVCNTSNCVTGRPVRGYLTPKMNIAFFIANFVLNIFLFNNFFEKSCIFRENGKKLFWGSI